jgi:predicted kinase
MVMNSLILIRGLPGSGKSTLAQVLSEGKWPVFSVDDYFTDKNTGAYEFIFSENHKAYASCIERTREAMCKATSKIFVDNTFTLEWELEPYFALGSEFNYRVFCLTTEKRHSGLNAHGVNADQLVKMAEKYKVVLL